MNYIVDFSIISFLYLSITTIFYFKQNKVYNTRNIYFGVLLILGLLSLILDVTVALLDQNTNCPLFIVYILNILFLLCVQFNGPVFLGYTNVLTGFYPKMKKLVKILVLLPFIFITILIIISPFTSFGVFNLDKNNFYTPGLTHSALYIVMGLYLIAALLIAVIRMKYIQKKKIIVIVSFLIITITTMIIQLNNPNLLVNSMGNALSLTIMYHALQVNDENLDGLTKLLSNKSLDLVLQEMYEQKQIFTMKLFILNDFRIINQEYGTKCGDELMIQFSKYLKKEYPRAYLVRLVGDVYIVIDYLNIKTLKQQDLEFIKKRFPTKWEVNMSTSEKKIIPIELSFSLIGINGIDFKSVSQLQNIISYIVLKHEQGHNIDTLLVNDRYRDEKEYYFKVENVLETALKERSLEVYYQPIHNSEGKLVAFEALCRLIDPELGFINPDLFIEMAEKNGQISLLGEIVLEKVCDFINTYHIENWHLHHIGVNLSFIQCTDSNIYDKLMKILDKCPYAKDIISFEITETATDSSMEIVKSNMLKFIKAGYSFMLDDFGSGYANYNYILELPFKCIKIDKNILWQAMKTPRDMLYLKTLVEALKNLHKDTICEGVETTRQCEILNELGVNMQQGYLYSKALNSKDTIKYRENTLKSL